jgi:ribosome-associated translation inhibitor RaiA
MKSNVIEMQIQRHQMAADINSKTPMNIILRYHGLNARAFWKRLVEAQLNRLRDLAAIASARVTLEWQHEVKPAFRVLALLEVPGPDFHAEASDYTLQAALLKVVKDLERQIRVRKSRQADKRKTNVQLGLLPGRSSLTLAGSRA